MTDSVVVEGYCRLREGKKWKTRWLVLRKPSPVADCLLVLVFKDKCDKAQGNKERAGVTLEEICGLETAQGYEGVAFTLSILCLNQAAVLGFDSRETLQAWEVRLRYSLGEVHRFSVSVLPGTKLDSGPATLHLCNNLLSLARDVPPVIVGHWNLPDLRRYGPVPNGFVFEGGTRCGFWAGVFLLASAESEQISFLFDCVVRGISPTRGPFGLRPLLPDPGAGQGNSEERLNLEAQELEKRLSLLSHRSSTVSSVYVPSGGGDDRSISGSSDTSDTSQSDGSVSSRLAAWTQPASGPSDHTLPAGARLAPQSAEKLSIGQGGTGRPAGKAPRQLQEIGRQSSSDSGIATGSHSSYSGSFSSYTGSLDIPPGEDFGSAFGLPPRLAQDLSPCTCPTDPGHDYQVPTSLRYLYDSPKSLIHEGREDAKDVERLDGDPPVEPLQGAKRGEGHLERDESSSVSQVIHAPSEDSRKTRVAPSSDSQHPESCHSCSSVTSKTIVTICSVCGGLKGMPFLPAGVSVVPALPGERGHLHASSPMLHEDQSVDKSPCTAGSSENSNAGKKLVEDPRCAAGSSWREESLLPKKGRDKLASLLADLLRSPRVEKEPQEKTGRLRVYELMSPAPGNEPTPPQRHRNAANYENCSKCQVAHCHPPPRVVAAQGRTNRSETSRGEESQELSGRTLTREDKRCRGKDERRRADPAYEIMERSAPEAVERRRYEPMAGCGQQRFLQEADALFPLADRPRCDAATYVNIPVSPTSKKQLNYMELELQEPGTRGGAAAPPAPRKTTTKYAQIDITATETAHKVGSQHALGRQEGLHTLELRRKGAPH